MKKQKINQKDIQKKQQNVPITNNEKKTRLIGGKYLTLIIVVVLLCLCGWGVHSCSRYVYARKVKDFKTNALLQQRMYANICDDMLSQWTVAELGGTALKSGDKMARTVSTEAILEKIAKRLESNGALQALSVLREQAASSVDGAIDAPNAFKSEGAAFQTAKECLAKLADIISKPGNDILAFAGTTDELLNQLVSALDKTDFNFYVPYNEVNNYLERIKPLLTEKKWADVMSADVKKKGNHRYNSLKYLKMGFEPLADSGGVLFKVLTEGQGPVPTADSSVRLHYEGKLMDGTIFDSSYSKGQPVVMKPMQTVKGFNKALTNMPTGSKWEVFIPFDQAYGERSTGIIPPNADLFFTIETISIE